LRLLTPQARICLLIELERLEACPTEVPGAASLLQKLRASFAKVGKPIITSPSRDGISSIQWGHCWSMAR
jgi:hypothetical protein